jgi:hypothetical protein
MAGQIGDDNLDDVLSEAERIANASDEVQQLRSALHTLVDLWPREGLAALVQAVNEAFVALPDVIKRPKPLE